MLLKILNGFSQAAIIILAFVLIITITNKHASNLALEDFQTQVNARFEEDKKYYDNRIKTVQDNLNTYQQTREARAQLYSKRMDELYDLYKKDPSPIDNAKSVVAIQAVSNDNFPYLESKINSVSEKLDNENNKLNSRVMVLERRVETIQSDRNTSQRIINTNIQTNSNK